ncbi:SRP40, C-terminal domain-containing protein [Cardiosporidium cionae]|uniref:SRP40, C-terminal domain-containing protein n=1 Tax=Cardiosporidium cionae TaxID=476202 RepID=A0ABQ7J893_9APIC|nr:SRP40, C-terminal domain-containing protein [Cardiosporidium cionae]|eukprot:KAF8820197.1 SRP40, C-terminal domain-containing protein [Cardiosporidium cionae]
MDSSAFFHRLLYHYFLSRNFLKTARFLQKECDLNDEVIKTVNQHEKKEILSLVRKHFLPALIKKTTEDSLISEFIEEKCETKKKKKNSSVSALAKEEECKSSVGAISSSAVSTILSQDISFIPKSRKNLQDKSSKKRKRPIEVMPVSNENSICPPSSSQLKGIFEPVKDMESAAGREPPESSEVKTSVPSTYTRAKKAFRANAPFKRINNSYAIAVTNEELKDNSFWNKKSDDFATKAATDLGGVRGKEFRQMKAKKKKANWTGMGEVPMGINSVQFDSD